MLRPSFVLGSMGAAFVLISAVEGGVLPADLLFKGDRLAVETTAAVEKAPTSAVTAQEVSPGITVIRDELGRVVARNDRTTSTMTITKGSYSRSAGTRDTAPACAEATPCIARVANAFDAM